MVQPNIPVFVLPFGIPQFDDILRLFLHIPGEKNEKYDVHSCYRCIQLSSGKHRKLLFSLGRQTPLHFFCVRIKEEFSLEDKYIDLSRRHIQIH
jgi:hypothetical protein